VAASGRSRQGEATGEEARWPSDQDEDRVGPLRPWAKWFSSFVSGANGKCVIALIREGAAPKLTPLAPIFFLSVLRFSSSSILVVERYQKSEIFVVFLLRFCDGK
jgi:hypothetical protein